MWMNKKYRYPEKYEPLFLDAKPFEHIVLRNFFAKEKLKKILAAFKAQQFHSQSSDLFQFSQTNDLKKTKDKQLKEFYHFFSSRKFIQYISKLTKTKLKKINMSGFTYSSTDYLLPHDDRLEGRKIAYIVNLSKLKEADGGALELFEVNNSRATKVVRSYPPQFNSLVLFKVTPSSFHQVSEVLSDKKRYTLTGWFHG